MEADWEFEVGGDAPVIEALWAGFVDLRSQPDGFLRRQRPFKRSAPQILHHQVIGSYVVNRADVRMIERGDRAGFAFQPVHVFRVEKLNGDFTAEPRVEGAINFAHAAGAQQRKDLVRSHPSPCGKSHKRCSQCTPRLGPAFSLLENHVTFGVAHIHRFENAKRQ